MMRTTDLKSLHPQGSDCLAASNMTINGTAQHVAFPAFRLMRLPFIDLGKRSTFALLPRVLKRLAMWSRYFRDRFIAMVRTKVLSASSIQRLLSAN
jgi:hypothetical protein